MLIFCASGRSSARDRPLGGSSFLLSGHECSHHEDSFGPGKLRHVVPVPEEDIMEPGQGTTLPCPPNITNNHPNDTSKDLSATGSAMVTSLLGFILATMCLIGVAGNIYTLVVINRSKRLTGSMSVYIVNLALADLLYLSTIPFIVSTYVLKDWYFGDVGCRILFSLDLLTMHASIFILLVMSMERYLAVVRPLDTIRRPRDYRRMITCSVWLVSFLLALPTMILIDLRTSVQGGVVKRMCYPTWQMEAYKVYLTILFNTCILAPGVVICYLYVQLARTYWRSQVAIFSPKEVKRCPRQKVLYMIFSIILAYWTCFIPFWLWQLLGVYHHQTDNIAGNTVVNFAVTCLAYSNSCINPFLYTLLSKNYKEYIRSRPKNSTSLSKIKPRRNSSKRSVLSGSHQFTETVAVAQLKGINREDVISL